LVQALTIGHPEYPPTIFFFKKHPVRRPDVQPGCSPVSWNGCAHREGTQLIDGEDGEKERRRGEPVEVEVKD